MWSDWDPLFVIGNGTDTGAFRSNAMTILKNGRVGLQSITSPNYALELPNNSDDGIGKAIATEWIVYSDGRLKSKRENIPYGLNEIMKLKPLKYFHQNSNKLNGIINIEETGQYDIGLIAQDVYKIIPEIVNLPANENSELWSMNYEKLTPVLIKAIQEQQKQIDDLTKKYDELLKLMSNQAKNK